MPSLCVLWAWLRLPSEHSSFGWVSYQNTQYTQNIHQLGGFFSQILWPKTNWSLHTPTPIPLNYCLIFLPFHMPAQEISCLRFIFQSRSSFQMWGPTENSLAIEDCFLHHFLSKYKFLWLAMFELSLKTHVTRKTHCFSLCISISPHCGHMLPSHGHLLHSMLLLALWPQCCLWKKKTKCFFYSIWFHPKRLDSSMR